MRPLTIVALLWLAPALSAAAPATLVLVGGDVRTMDPARPRATAIAITGDRVTAVGTDAEVLRLAGPATRQVALGGRLVTPGLVDAHAHVRSLGEEADELDLRDARSEAEAGARLAGYARAHPTGPIFGHAWDQNRWQPARFPDRRTLDAAAPGRLVALSRVDGHALWVSSAVLAAARVDRKTADPRGGRVLRRPDGEPTGVLVDGAMGLVSAALPDERDDASVRRVLELALGRIAAEGLTGVHDMGTTWQTLRVLAALDAAGRLPIRISAYIRRVDAERLWKEGPPAPTPHLVVRGVKAFVDGALGSRGAALLEPYSDAPGERGLEVATRKELAALATQALGRGYQVATHAIGDAGVRTVLDAYADALGPSSRGKARLRIEHAQVVSASDLPRFAALGVVASMQPTHATSDGPWASARLGPRIAGAYAWRSLARAGATIAFGSDFPVEAPSPILGLLAATTRRGADGRPPGGFPPANERLTLDEAIAAYTTGAARAAMDERDGGVLAVGRRADVTVLDLAGAAADRLDPLGAARAYLTIVGGKIVFAR